MAIINLFFLLVIAFIPFAAGLLSDYVPDNLAVAAYSAVMAFAGLTLVVMTVYPKNRGHFHPGLSLERVSLVTKKMAMAPIVFIIAIPVAFLSGWAAIALWALIPAGRWVIGQRAG